MPDITKTLADALRRFVANGIPVTPNHSIHARRVLALYDAHTATPPPSGAGAPDEVERLRDEAKRIAREYALMRATDEEAFAAIDALAASRVAPASTPAGWISVDERMPEPGTGCLVWVLDDAGGGWVTIDHWNEQHESPVSFSTHTIPTGLAWDDHEFEEISHWMPCPAAPSSPSAEPQAGEEAR